MPSLRDVLHDAFLRRFFGRVAPQFLLMPFLLSLLSGLDAYEDVCACGDRWKGATSSPCCWDGHVVYSCPFHVCWQEGKPKSVLSYRLRVSDLLRKLTYIRFPMGNAFPHMDPDQGPLGRPIPCTSTNPSLAFTLVLPESGAFTSDFFGLTMLHNTTRHFET